MYLEVESFRSRRQSSTLKISQDVRVSDHSENFSARVNLSSKWNSYGLSRRHQAKVTPGKVYLGYGYNHDLNKIVIFKSGQCFQGKNSKNKTKTLRTGLTKNVSLAGKSGIQRLFELFCLLSKRKTKNFTCHPLPVSCPFFTRHPSPATRHPPPVEKPAVLL